MDKLKDILNNIKDRFTNPLVFSLICSWLIFNWQITVALLWYDSNQIEKSGFKNIFDFICDKTNQQYSLLYPLCFAIGYTVLMPIIKNLIRAFYSWAGKWGENWNLKILGGGKIPVEKYLSFRSEYEKRTKILEDVISKENEFVDKYNSLNTDLLKAQSNESELRQKLTEAENLVRQFANVRILDGYWTNTYDDTDTTTGLQGSEEIYINDGKYYLIGQFGEPRHVFNIIDFHYDGRNKAMNFIKQRLNQDKLFIPPYFYKYNFNFLSVQEDNSIVGRENETVKISYKRKPISDIAANSEQK